MGCISCKDIEAWIYDVVCLRLVPTYQGKGIGTQAVKFITSYYKDWNKITLITPVDKTENVKFYIYRKVWF